MVGPKSTIVFWVSVAVMAAAFASAAHSKFGDFYDLPGRYCKAPVGDRCCDGRVDECSFPILGTRCYCDQFCNRTVNPDCCPDYWNTCLGIKYVGLEGPGTLIQPSPCLLNGVLVPHLQKAIDNCNTCKCNSGNLECTTDTCLLDNKFVRRVEGVAIRAGWVARNYSKFWGREVKEGLQLLTGTIKPEESSLRIHPIHLVYDTSIIPKSFDARSQWPWAGVGKIWDQGWCGSSWAFSTASVAEDRLAIESGGKEAVKLSRQNLLSCNRRGQQACKGGHIDRAWNYLRRYGVVTDECYPYTSGNKGASSACKVAKGDNLLSGDCKQKSFPMGRKELYRTEPPYRIASNEEDIMWELMTTGPVQAIMKVYRDFLLYGGGIYTREGLGEDSHYSYHSVKIFGWGEEIAPRGTSRKYWLCMNSWGDLWGERGTFKIRRGMNETDIEHFIITSRARLTDRKYMNELRARRRHSRRSSRRRRVRSRA